MAVMSEAVARLLAQRVEQGLPATVEDPATLEILADILRGDRDG